MGITLTLYDVYDFLLVINSSPGRI